MGSSILITGASSGIGKAVAFELAKKGYSDGIIFHRVIPNFMVQTGDPTGTGRGGPVGFTGPEWYVNGRCTRNRARPGRGRLAREDQLGTHPDPGARLLQRDPATS